MRIEDRTTIQHNGTVKRDLLPQKDIQKQNQPFYEQHDTMKIGVSAKEMNQWFAEARDWMINPVSKRSELQEEVQGMEVVAKVLGEIQHDGKRNGNI